MYAHVSKQKLSKTHGKGLLFMPPRKLLSPITWPVLSFALAIAIGTLLLSLPVAVAQGQELAFIDALFLATSAVCVTGLSPVDIGTVLSLSGQSILLMLIQLGGLGITTYTSLVFILWRNRVPVTDRLAVHQALLNKDVVNVRTFIWQLVLLVLTVELVAALALYLHDPIHFSPFNAIFHAISAFCNAGFSPFPQNLIPFKDDVMVNGIIGSSIILGGLGFAVLHEIRRVFQGHILCFFAYLRKYFGGKKAPAIYPCDTFFSPRQGRPQLDKYSRLVLMTSLALVLFGAMAIFTLEILHMNSLPSFSLALSSFFQSISLRTAGFNSVDIRLLSDASLLIMVALMFIGGAPGSCAGGIKITTFRVLLAFMRAQISGEKNIVVRDRGVRPETVSQALMLFFFGALTIGLSVILLCITENASLIGERTGAVPLLTLIFEVVSAFATVGYSLGQTPLLSDVGKGVIILNMFIGRVGFIGFLTALHSLRPSRKYAYPTMPMPIG